MAVITRFIVVRNGVELDKVFEVKKEADAYDKMLDAADNLAAFIKKSDLQVELDTKTIEAVAVCLAKNAPEVNKILKGVKPYVPAAPAADNAEKPADDQTASAKARKATGKKPKAKRTQK
ncbi:MAG: YebG family protein [Desulfobacteraceae bacterium]|jgi:dsDNA-binding SOS-regulon protein